ncbi:MAG: hypothetical protein IJ824_06520, partial [Alphaproteobacteria bacterium]|nr:hypothetical protein [Alphaproteobacteria bacterium]
MTSLSEQIRGYLLGGQPIKRQDRKAGQTQYYYINPGQEYATAGSLKTTDIPDEMMNPDGTMKTTGSFNNMQKYNQEVMNNINQQQVQTNDPNCYIEFNGQDVDLYKYGQYDGNRLQNGQLQDNLNGQSGGDDYQSGIYQDVPNKGPIPEGPYYADQSQRQNITAFDTVAGIVGHGKWAGSLPAWAPVVFGCNLMPIPILMVVPDFQFMAV